MKFFVKFDCTIHPDNYQAQCESVSGVTFHSALKCIPGVVIVSADSLMVAPELQKLAGVVYVEADSTVEAALTPDDTYPSDAGLVQINAHAAWDLETGDGSIIVGVIDSGLKLDHEDIVANLWIDPNASYPKSGYDFYNADTDPTDVYGHGTAMSGIIAAVGNNAKGLAGVCWAAKIMALKCSESGTFNLTAVVSAIDFAIDHGARVLNMSYTSAVYSETEAAAMQAAYEAGLLCVCSAGNTGTNNDTAPKYPASYTLPNIISVMGTNRFKGIASAGNGGFNSCYGKTSVDIAAPSFVDKALLLNGSYGALASGGTSQSAAYVSGVCALVLSARPDLHALDVKRIIMESAFPMSVITTGDLLHPSDLSMTGGIVDAFAAVKMALVYESRTAPLSEKVKGRLVNLKSVRREDGKFDVETEVTWPEASFLKDAETVLAAPDANTTVEAGTGTAKILRFGTVGREIKDEFGVETDKLPVFDYEDSDLTDGLYKTTTRLMGIQSQIPELTPSKKWNWRLNTETIRVPSAAWFVHAIGREWKKLVTPKTLSWQQIRRMIGGDLAFNKNQETGALTGVDWNEDFDDAGGDYPRAAAPDIWISHGYQRRYGPWKPYWKQGYLMGPGSIRTNASGGVICRGPLNGYDFYQIGDVVWDGSAFKVLSGATEWSAAGGNAGGAAPTNNVLGAVLKSGNKVYTCINANGFIQQGSIVTYAYVTPPNSPDGRYFFSEGAQYGTGKLVSANFSAFDSSLVVSKIAISGGGEAPFEQPDLYIPVVQIVSDEVDWDLDWEWNATSTYANGQVRFFLEDGLVYEAVDSPAAGESPSDEPTKWTATTTKNPTGWDADGRNTRYGDWSVAWSKGYLTGAGSIKTNTLGASQCKGFYVATSDYQLGDVVWNDSNSDFEIASSATEWSAAGGNIQVAPTNNELGAVLKSGNKVYTCINASNYVLIGSNAVYAYVTPPNSPDGRYFFSEGGIGSEITWVSFDRDYIVSKIASKGIGLAPFETVERIGVIDASSGYAAAPSARVSFYTNPHENPECFEAGHRVRRHEDVIVLRTYFAIDPIWVANRRIPDDISEFGNSLFHLEDPNVFAEYKTIQVGDLYAIELIITRIGEYEADELTSSSDPNEGATADESGKTQMNGSPRNYPQVDRDGYWGVYHRIPAVDRVVLNGGVSGRPDGAYKDVG